MKTRTECTGLSGSDRQLSTLVGLTVGVLAGERAVQAYSSGRVQ